jgi:hypothetical protein
MRRVQDNQQGLELNGAYKPQVCVDDINLFGEL